MIGQKMDINLGFNLSRVLFAKKTKKVLVLLDIGGLGPLASAVLVVAGALKQELESAMEEPNA